MERAEHEPEEGEISDDGETWKDEDNKQEKLKSLTAQDGPIIIPPKHSSLTESDPVSKNSSSTWQGGVGGGSLGLVVMESNGSNSSSKQQGWALFSHQSDQFFQRAWQKGVQGSPKESAVEEEEASDSIELMINKEKLPRSQSFIGVVHRSGDKELHRSFSWTSNQDLEQSFPRVVGGEDGPFVVDMRRGDENGASLREDWREKKTENFDRSPVLRSSIEKVFNGESAEEKNGIEDSPSLSSITIIHQGNGKREEGELEEGEIEGDFRSETGSLLHTVVSGESSGKPSVQGLPVQKNPGNPQPQNQDNPLELFPKCKEREVLKSYPKTYSRYDLKGGKNQFASKTRCMSESSLDEMVAKTAELLSNVTVKDAQRSFMGVCKQLRVALKNLQELCKQSGIQGRHVEGLSCKISTLSREIFSGLRAAYAVRNTASGKEQEQNKEFFPRLLESACVTCQTLFTSKQMRELESMMGTPTENFNYPNDQQKDGSQSDIMRLEESECNTRESSNDTRALGGAERNFNFGNDSDCHPLTSVASHMFLGVSEASQTQDTIAIQNSTIPRAPFSSEPHPLSSLGIPEGLEGLRMSGLVESSTTKIADSQDELAQNQAWPDHLDVVASYREKFAGKSALTQRLPSPTPSEEENGECNPRDYDIESSASDAKPETPVVFSLEESKGNMEVVAGCSTDVNPEEKTTMEENLLNGEHLKAFLCSPPQETESDLQTLACSVVSLNGGGREIPIVESISRFPRGSLKPRDPRRRLLNPLVDDHETSGLNKNIEDVNVQLHANLCNPLRETHDVIVPKGEKTLLELNPPLKTGTLSTIKAMDTNTEEFSSSLKRTAGDSDALFGCSLSSNKRLKIDLNRPGEEFITPAEGMQDLVKGGDELGADLTNSVTEEKVTQQVVGNSSKSSIAMESPLVRMKPRDPRKVLLGTIQEKSESKELISGTVNSAISKEGNRLILQSDNSSVSGDTLGSLLNEKQSTSISNGISDGVISTIVPARNTKTTPSGENQSQDLVPRKEHRISHNKDTLKPNEPKSIFEDSLKAPKVRPSSINRGNIEPPRYEKHLDSSKDWEKIEPLLQGLDGKQREAVRQERARRIEEQNRMLSSRKLCLVLDLDHTLLNSAKFTEIEEEWEPRLRATEAAAERNKFVKDGIDRRELYRFPHMGMWTKLRPGIWNFLARASQMYELHVYTMGNKAYATEMAKLLDPTGTLFVGRVISKGDDGDGVDGDERIPKSKDLDGVLGMESAVVIIDDSARVWPHHRHNLIVVERYMYFPCSRRQFGLPGPSLLEVGHDEREADGMLASVLAVIDRIHASFFSQKRLHEVDVREILASEQQRVLAGCRILFSRVFPQGECQPHLHPLWQVAQQFGATCTTTADDGVTHVVAISLGTDKVNWALASGRHVVRPAWLEASSILYRRSLEQDFPVSQ